MQATNVKIVPRARGVHIIRYVNENTLKDL